MMMTKATIVLLATLASTSAFAQGMDHATHAASGATEDNMSVMDSMMESMNGMEMSGDPDADFLLMMIPHHQSAIDMAKIELEQGDDPETRKMAQEIIDAQEQEIAEMKTMLERLGVDAPE